MKRIIESCKKKRTDIRIAYFEEENDKIHF